MRYHSEEYHIDKEKISMIGFSAGGTKGSMVGMDETINYITHAQNDGCDVSVVVAEGQDHAFGQKYYMDEYIKWIQGIFENKIELNELKSFLKI